MGFIGSNATAHLLNTGHQIIGIDNLSNPSITPTDRIKKNSGSLWKNFKFYDCDIRQLNTLTSIALNEKPDVIVHLAALGSVPRSFENPSLVIDVNDRGFCNVLTLASSVGVKRVVFASSSSVYGDHPMSLRIEGNEGNPLSPYALTKKNNEFLAQIWSKHYSLQFIGLRFFNVYGPGQLINSPYSAVIPKFINDPVIAIYGDGETKRDFTYVDDVSRAIELSLTSKRFNFVCNIGTGNATTLNELAKLITKKTPKEILKIQERSADVKASVAHTYEASELLNFKSSVNINEGLNKTIAYYQGISNG